MGCGFLPAVRGDLIIVELLLVSIDRYSEDYFYMRYKMFNDQYTVRNVVILLLANMPFAFYCTIRTIYIYTSPL